MGIDDDASTTVQVAGLTKGATIRLKQVLPMTKVVGFKINFDTSTPLLKAAAGNKLTITYDATLTNAAVPDKALNNKATLNIDNGTGVTSTPDSNQKFILVALILLRKISKVLKHLLMQNSNWLS